MRARADQHRFFALKYANLQAINLEGVQVLEPENVLFESNFVGPSLGRQTCRIDVVVLGAQFLVVKCLRVASLTELQQNEVVLARLEQASQLDTGAGHCKRRHSI